MYIISYKDIYIYIYINIILISLNIFFDKNFSQCINGCYANQQENSNLCCYKPAYSIAHFPLWSQISFLSFSLHLFICQYIGCRSLHIWESTLNRWEIFLLSEISLCYSMSLNQKKIIIITQLILENILLCF